MKIYTMGYLRRGNTTLMLHRNKEEADGSNDRKWNGVGGKFEAKEMPEECFKREVLEETGFTIKNIRYIGLLTLPEFAKGEDTTIYVFESDEFEGELTEDKSEGDFHWIDNDKIQELNLWDADKLFIPEVLKGNSFSIKVEKVGEKLEHKLIVYPGKSEYSEI